MARLIDADALVPYLWALFKFFGSLPCSEADKATQRGIKRCIGEIEKMPTVDAVEVVRCGECKHFREPFCTRRDDETHRERINMLTVDFCSYGERRTET